MRSGPRYSQIAPARNEVAAIRKAGDASNRRPLTPGRKKWMGRYFRPTG